MTTASETTLDLTVVTPQPQVGAKRSLIGKVGRFLLHFLEMSVAMGLGMAVFHVLRLQLPAGYAAAFEPGTNGFVIADDLFMTLPMAAWMLVRGHGWRHSMEMSASMLVPGAAILVARLLGSDAYFPWLPYMACPVICSSMVIYMIVRHEHYTGSAGHAAHADDPSGEKPCH